MSNNNVDTFVSNNNVDTFPAIFAAALEFQSNLGERFIKMESRPAVNYGMLRNHVGKMVSVIGKVLDINPSGNQIKLELSDGKDVLVTLKDALEELLHGYVHIVASVERDETLTAENIISFGSSEIDLKVYNDAVQLASKYSELFSFSEANGLRY